MHQAIITASLLLIASNSVAADPLLLTGQIKASSNQVFYAPKTDNWQVQVKWLKPEGDIVEKGELVVVFDSGTIESNVEQDKVSLLSAKEQLQRLKNSGEHKELEATYKLKRASLLLEKARIDGAISVQYLSNYDYQKNQLALKKAIITEAKEQQLLKQVKISNLVALNKQQLTVKKHQDTLTFHQAKLDDMSLYAQRSGSVIYGTHPWNGEKVFVGMTARPTWKMAEVPSITGLYIEAWVHEVDISKLHQQQLADLTFDRFPDHKLTAKLTELSTQPEERKQWGNDVYFRAVFEFSDEENLTLLPGMSAQIELQGTVNE